MQALLQAGAATSRPPPGWTCTRAVPCVSVRACAAADSASENTSGTAASACFVFSVWLHVGGAIAAWVLNSVSWREPKNSAANKLHFGKLDSGLERVLENYLPALKWTAASAAASKWSVSGGNSDQDRHAQERDGAGADRGNCPPPDRGHSRRRCRNREVRNHGRYRPDRQAVAAWRQGRRLRRRNP